MNGRRSKLVQLLRCDLSAPRLARQAMRGLAGIEPVRDDALLVVTELVSNAVLHAGCEPHEEIELVAERRPDGLRIAVADVGRSGKTPVCENGSLGIHRKLGLRLVRALARRWGIERGDGLRVWAELAA